ncbi:MAG: YfhO family protein [Chloroflexi bacterium]|nr:YfhO family protein [Chloroflexota bacterium]
MKITMADTLFWAAALILYAAAWLALKRRRADLAAAGWLGLITAGFFWRVLFAGAFMPEGGGDISAILYPVYHFAQENLRQGVIPLWNPYLYGGIPFVGHIQSGPFYPPNLLMFFVTPEVTYRALEYLLIAHYWLAGVLMYALLRDLHSPGGQVKDLPLLGRHDGLTQGLPRLTRPAAMLGAVVFMFNDFNITHIGNPNMVAVGAWLPLVLLLYRRAVTQRRSFWAMAAGAVTGMAYLAGHIQPFLYILLAVGLYAVYEAACDLRERRLSGIVATLRALVYPVGLLVLFMAFTVGAGAISLLPNVEMSAQSLRDTLNYADAARFSLPPAELVGLFVPGLFGRGPNIHWGAWERVEIGYVGILPLVLAALGAIWRKDRLPRFFLALGLLSLALALGFFSIVHGWLYLIPGYSQIRVPARFIYLMDFAIAALAAYGFDALLRPLPRAWRLAWRKLPIVLAVTLAATLFILMPLQFSALAQSQSQDISIFNRIANGFNGLALFALLIGGSLALVLARRSHWLSRSAWAVAVIAFVFIDLASLGAYLDTGEKDPTANFSHPEAFAFLRADTSLHRIETPEESWFQFQPNLGLIAHLDDAAGIYNPLLLQRYARYWGIASARDNVLYDLLNTKYLIARKDAKVAAKFTPVFDGAPLVNVYLNPKALPRAFMVYNAVAAPGGDEAFAAITRPGFDPTQTIVIEGAASLPVPAPRSNPQAQIALKARGANYEEYTVTNDVDGWFFTGDVYYSGWRATVDGQDAPLLHADYLFRAVYLPAGTHTVRMVFDPLTFKLGAALTALAVAALAGAWWRIR